MSDFLGCDIYETGGTFNVHNGGFEKVSGEKNLLKAVAHRLRTPVGALFYDSAYGSYLYQYQNIVVTDQTILEIEAEIERCIAEEERVDEDSISVTVTGDTDGAFTAEISFSAVDSDTELNLVVSDSKEQSEIITEIAG